MTKFFDKKLEDELGTGAALQIAAIGADLRSQMDAMDAIRIAQGRPTMQQELDEVDNYLRDLIAKGDAKREDYPELFEDVAEEGGVLEELLNDLANMKGAELTIAEIRERVESPEREDSRAFALRFDRQLVKMLAAGKITRAQFNAATGNFYTRIHMDS